MDADKVTLRGAAVQIMATFSIAGIAFLSGSLFTWPSYNVANFVSNGTVLSEPMTSLHVSLLGGVMNFGTIVLTPVVGIVTNRIGRKYTMITVGFFFLIAWTIISFSTSIPVILVSVTIAGCGTAGQAVCVIYLSEIAHDSIRGAMSSSIQIVYYFGTLVSYLIGGYLQYSHVIYVLLSVSILNILVLSMLKDSPIYLLQKGREKEAAESLAFYRQRRPDSKQVENEVAKIKAQLNVGVDTSVDGEDPATKTFLPHSEQKKLSEWQFLKQSPSSIRAFITSLMIMAFMILMGNIPMQVYAETLLTEATPSFNANKCSVWLAVDFILATFACMLTIDKLGRKTLTIFSSVFSSICMVIIATQMQFHWASEWVTMALLFFYNFIFNMGMAVMPFVLIGELFLPEHATGDKLYREDSSWEFVFAVYSYFYLPETKGLPVDVIQALFLSKSRKKFTELKI